MVISSINTTDYAYPLPSFGKQGSSAGSSETSKTPENGGGPEKGAKTGSAGTKELSEEEKKEVEKLKATDREVRAHEQAHMAAGAGIVRGGPHYEYQKGPDGQTYAVGGEVSIDTSEGKTPVDTMMKMQRVRAAALAPANPSGQDLSVAAQASSKEAEARIKMAKEQNTAGKSGKNNKAEGAVPSETTPSPITSQAHAAYEGQKKQAQRADITAMISLII
ncbi:MAG: putative metalloprotease CJM1_0395 family protein [Fibrobacterota bacterium]